jgi:hypothetical protein
MRRRNRSATSILDAPKGKSRKFSERDLREERWNRRHEAPLQLLTCPDANRTPSPVTVTTESLKTSLVPWSTVKLVCEKITKLTYLLVSIPLS